jgi:class 3 adenylate cyclase
MQCLRCQHENPPGAKFCVECASPVARGCPACGTEAPPTAKFCPECGAEIKGLGARGSGLRDSRSTVTPNPLAYTPKHLADKILTERAALEGERKQVTVLFADVKGSMELAEQVDP